MWTVQERGQKGKCYQSWIVKGKVELLVGNGIRAATICAELNKQQEEIDELNEKIKEWQGRHRR